MATITTITYNSAATSITFTSLSSLAASNIAGAESTLVDNTSNKYVDAQVEIKIIYSAAIPAGFALVGITSSVGGTLVSSPAAGTDGALTLKQSPMFPNNFQPGPGGSLYLPASSIFYAMQFDFTGYATTPTVDLEIPSIAACIGSPQVLPTKWGLFAMNRTSASFGAACTATYTGVTYTNT